MLNPNLYDEALWRIDRWVHLGLSPVHLSLRFLSAPWCALVIDRLYAFWYALKAPFLIYVIWLAKSGQRMHFLTSYLLLWMIGGAFAIAFPSLGLVYPNPELFEHLNTPTAHKLQLMLWQQYQQLLVDPAGLPNRLQTASDNLEPVRVIKIKKLRASSKRFAIDSTVGLARSHRPFS